MKKASPKSLLAENTNCWCLAHAARAAFLIDGASYFSAVADAMDQARKSIFIAAWDIDSRISLDRGHNKQQDDTDLGTFLNAKAKHTPGLQVYILNWDFPMLYTMEREWLPIFKLGWKTHDRVFFHLDDQHPVGASQHQKIVVIDNQVAFCGGLDLTNSRWDTPEHRLDDARRKNPDKDAYNPFHDVQVVVEGDAAAALGRLFTDRWKGATSHDIAGHALSKEEKSDSPWPGNLEPDLTDIHIGISRTLPAYKCREQVQEVENLYTDAINAAKKNIYIENQYLTSARIAEELEKSLSREQGPEIAIVLPAKSSGWLEQSTMDSIRARILKSLFEADDHHRLGVFYPVLDDGKTALYIHSKLLIADDRLAIIGSANLSNRSMRFDSECVLAVESSGEDRTGAAIASLRNRLMAEHLDTSADAVASAFSKKNAVNQVIASLSASSGRRLEKLAYDQALPVDGAAIVRDHELLDPEKPIAFDRMMDRFARNDQGQSRKPQVMKLAAVLLILLGLAAAWRWSPLAEWATRENMAVWAGKIQDHPLSYLIVLGMYVAGGFLMVPVTLLVGVTAMVFDPVMGALYAWSGCLVSALLTFWAGAGLGKQMVRKVAGKKLNHVSQQMAKQGILTVAVIRNIPVAPFSLVNLIAGASHIRLKDYLLGTAAGMLPGILVITVFADRLLHTIQHPGWVNGLIAAALAVVMIAGNMWITRRLSGNGEKK
ncbi:MAG TPA: VTT domain-containing protein [Desulfotignum sp.]|nr:VTT domain-containing protein [Desulfotignum sp.]